MKCFSIDLDGTLLNSEHQIPDENLAVLHELRAQGHEVILNTGRALPDVIKIEGVDQLDVPIFCINGSALYSKDRDLLYEATIDVDRFRDIFQTVRGLGAGILVYTNKGGMPSTLPPLHKRGWDEIEKMFAEFDYDSIYQIKNLKIYKLIALVNPNEPGKIEQVKKALQERSDLSIASSFPNNLEITSSEAHKGKAILRYQEIKKLKFEEIYAFGDGGNDIAQFEVATISVAMGNAPKEVQEKADFVTKTNDENGFAYAVKEILKIGIF